MASIDLKDIHMGSLIYQRVTECNIEKSCICNFLSRSEEEVDEIYQSKSVDLDVLLECSKLLGYDFFRLYSHHLVLYASLACTDYNKKDDKAKQSLPPAFRKNMYTQEIIKFILELVKSGEKTKQQIIDEYKIPKTTLYKWMIKYKN